MEDGVGGMECVLIRSERDREDGLCLRFFVFEKRMSKYWFDMQICHELHHLFLIVCQ